MSPLTHFTPLTARACTAASLRHPSALRGVPLAVALGSRGISSTREKEMDPVQTTKDTLKKVDRAASDVAIKGIDRGGM